MLWADYTEKQFMVLLQFIVFETKGACLQMHYLMQVSGNDALGPQRCPIDITVNQNYGKKGVDVDSCTTQ